MPDPINYVTDEQLIAINKAVGETGTIANRANLDFILIRVRKAADVYKAASYLLYGIATKHPFIDGNKRTALNAMLYFLEANGKKVEPSEETKTFMLKLIYNIVNNIISEADLEKEIIKVIA